MILCGTSRFCREKGSTAIHLDGETKDGRSPG